MGRQREKLKETVRVEGPGQREEKKGLGGRLWKPWEEGGSLGGEGRGGGPAPRGGGLLGSVGNSQCLLALIPDRGPSMCSSCFLTSLALSQDLIQTPH